MSRKHFLFLLAVLGVYAGLAIVYNVLQPLGEAPDEPAHVEFIRYIEKNGSLPKGQADLPTYLGPISSGIEFDQAPLYYIVLAPILGSIWLPPGGNLHRDPFIGWPNHPWRDAADLHRTDEGWPYHGLSLFVHAGRLAAVGYGLVVLLSTYALVFSLVRKRPAALFATASLAWTPGFLLASSRVNNDSAAMAWSALTILLCARIMIASRLRPLTLTALTFVTTAALLSKLNDVFLVPLVFVAVVIATPTAGTIWLTVARKVGLGAIVLTTPLAALVGWWLVYGRTFGGRLNSIVGFGVAQVGGDLQEITIARIVEAGSWLNNSWWGGIGAGTVALWDPVVYACFGFVACGLLLVGVRAAIFGSGRLETSRLPSSVVVDNRNVSGKFVEVPARVPKVCHTVSETSKTRRTMYVLTLAPLPLLYATLARQVFPWVNLDSNARFILPVASILALLVTLGWESLPKHNWRTFTASTLLGCVLILSVSTAWFLLPMIKAPNIPARLATTPEEASRTAIGTFANGVELMDLKGLPQFLEPSASIPILLSWRVDRSPNANFIAFVHLSHPLDGGLAAGGHDEIPLEKIFPPNLWQTGEIIDESQQIIVPSKLPAGYYTLDIGIYRQEGAVLSPIPVIGPGPPADSVTVRSWTVVPNATEFGQAHVDDAHFGEDVLLRGHIIRPVLDGIQVSLFWETVQPIDQNFVVSVQVLDESGQLVAQHDGEPVGGQLPTSLWTPQVLIRDDHLIATTSGRKGQQIIVLLYNRQSHQRMEVKSGAASGSDHFLIDP